MSKGVALTIQRLLLHRDGVEYLLWKPLFEQGFIVEFSFLTLLFFCDTLVNCVTVGKLRTENEALAEANAVLSEQVEAINSQKMDALDRIQTLENQVKTLKTATGIPKG